MVSLAPARFAPSPFAPSHVADDAFAVPQRLRVRQPTVAGDKAALGILAIIGSTLSFPLSDLTAQSLMSALPPIEVAWLRYMVFLLVCLPLMLRGRNTLRSVSPRFQILRGAMSAFGTLAALISFKYMAVPETTAIGFVSPVFVTALAMIVLKEQVGPRRWVAALVALCGVMIIVQPGASSFRPIALLPLIGAAGGALAVISTRLVKADDPRTTVFYAAIVGTVILTVAMLPGFVMPSLPQLKIVLVMGGFGALGMVLQVIGYRLGPASLLAPFSYTQLIWASGFAYLLLGSVPRPAVALGAAIIAGSALYTAARERARGIAA